MLGIAGVGVLFLIGYFWMQGHLTKVSEVAIEPERGTVTGTYVCLPLRKDVARESDCAAGVHSDDGKYYAIDFGLVSEGTPSFVEGDRLHASGIITPIETLSTDYWRQYIVEGIFSVTDSLQKLPPQAPELMGVYSGMLPCASCVGIDTTLEIFGSRTATSGPYRLASVYVGESETAIIQEGIWVRTENASGTALVLSAPDSQAASAAYQVVNARTLRLLNSDLSAIDSELPYDLTLRDQEETTSLEGHEWVWQYTTHRATGERIEPVKNDAFILQFSSDLSYLSTTDCNSLSGKYVVDQEVLSLGTPASTKMYCTDAQEQVYAQDLLLTNSFRIEGELLYLNLDRDFGTMVFKRSDAAAYGSEPYAY